MQDLLSRIFPGLLRALSSSQLGNHEVPEGEGACATVVLRRDSVWHRSARHSRAAAEQPHANVVPRANSARTGAKPETRFSVRDARSSRTAAALFLLLAACTGQVDGYTDPWLPSPPPP